MKESVRFFGYCRGFACFTLSPTYSLNDRIQHRLFLYAKHIAHSSASVIRLNGYGCILFLVTTAVVRAFSMCVFVRQSGGRVSVVEVFIIHTIMKMSNLVALLNYNPRQKRIFSSMQVK